MSFDNLVSATKAFIAFCVAHPTPSMFIVLLLVGVGVARFFKSLRELKREIVWIKTAIYQGTFAQRAVLGMGVLLSIGMSFVAVQAVVYFNRPRPTIRPVPAHTLGPETTIAWSYESALHDDKEHDLSFQVYVTDLDTQTDSPVKSTPESTFRLKRDGHLRVKVLAPSGGSSTITFDRYKDSLARIKTSGLLRVGVHLDDADEDDSNNASFCFQHSDGKYDGFDIDVLGIIANDLSSTLKRPIRIMTRYYSWPEIIDAPNSFDVDLAIASISITDERKQRVLFSDPYFTSTLALLQPKAGAPAESTFGPADLAGLTIGVHRDTTEFQFVEALSKTMQIDVVTFQTNKDLFSALYNQKVNAILYDYARSLEVTSQPGSNYIARQLTQETRRGPELYGMAFAKVNKAFADEVNNILKRRHQDLANAAFARHLNGAQVPRPGVALPNHRDERADRPKKQPAHGRLDLAPASRSGDRHIAGR